MARRYRGRVDGEVFRLGPGWHKVACCDCGLVHLARVWIRGRNIMMAAWRDRRATAAKRRRIKS